VVEVDQAALAQELLFQMPIKMNGFGMEGGAFVGSALGVPPPLRGVVRFGLSGGPRHRLISVQPSGLVCGVSRGCHVFPRSLIRACFYKTLGRPGRPMEISRWRQPPGRQKERKSVSTALFGREAGHLRHGWHRSRIHRAAGVIQGTLETQWCGL